MAEIINIHAAKTHLSRLVDRAAAGEEIVLARGGRPVARLVALSRTPERRPDLLAGRLRIAENFDAPLPKAVVDAFYGGRAPRVRKPK